MREGLTYADVLIVPQYSDIPTREDIDVTSFYLGERRLPIISAPMDTVTGPELAIKMFDAGAYGIIHRFGSWEERQSSVAGAKELNSESDFGISIGAKDWGTGITAMLVVTYKPHSVCIDVAHGHHQLVIDSIDNLVKLREFTGIPFKIIAGNVATAHGFLDLAKAGADAVRVGIGPGSACTTRETTGVGVPQLTALMDVVKIRKDFALPVNIIADGGIQNPGDIAKALAVGADAVMLGKMLAGADESAAPYDDPYHLRKIYRGQSTVGSNGLRGAPEGITGTVPATGPIFDTIRKLEYYLRSSFSYVGARNLAEFRRNVEFMKVSPATQIESGTRL